MKRSIMENRMQVKKKVKKKNCKEAKGKISSK